MSKTVPYKGAKFAGSVTFSDPLTLDQEDVYERAMGKYRKVRGEYIGPAGIALALLPGILPCVERFDVPGIPTNPTLETWPRRPRSAMASLVIWLTAEVGKLYADSTDTDAPNA